MRILATIASITVAARAVAGPYAPAAGVPGSTAIAHDDPGLIAWGSSIGEVVRGPHDISNPEIGNAHFGNPNPAALGPADGFDPFSGEPLTDPNKVVSLGDGGSITLLFPNAIFDGPSWDFAVFENAFNNTFLELAFVEVSDGDTWARFPSHSLTQTNVQIDQSTSVNGIDPTEIDGFAGKYRASFGTPFDLSLLAGTPGLDLNHIIAVRVLDVVGSIDPAYARRDSDGRIVNDPWPTDFPIIGNGGFDLDAIGVFHLVPEPNTALMLLAGSLFAGFRRRKRTL